MPGAFDQAKLRAQQLEDDDTTLWHGLRLAVARELTRQGINPKTGQPLPAASSALPV